MPTTAWKFAQTGVNWTNPNRISADDDSYATAVMGAGGSSPFLIAKNFGFTTSDVPTGATIDGVEFRVRWRRLSGYGVTVNNATMRFSWGGSDGDNKAASVPAISNTETSFTLGSTTDKWNASVLSTADGDDEVRNAEFGLIFRVINADAKYSLEVGIDSVEMRVTYTGGATTTTTSTTTTSTTTTSTTTTTTLASRRPTLGGRGLGSPYIGGYRPGFMRKD